jgi:hypothetical protein
MPGDVRLVRRARIVGIAVLALAGMAAAPSVAQWAFFGGDAGRSGYQPVDSGVAPVEPLWSATGPETQNVTTSILTTAGPPGEQRVVFGTGDRRNPDGDIVGGRVHVRRLATGAPVTPPEGVKLSDEPDAFGDGFGSVSFAETSTADALGQAWIVYNDVNGVSIAQVDEATGEVVQKRVPSPGDVNDKLVGITVNSSVLLSPADPDGARQLFFTAFGDTTTVETLYKVSIARASDRTAEITNITTVNGDFNLVDFASPSLVYLTANASNNEAHVAVGDCRGRMYTFAVDDLAPGPIAAIGAATDCVLTVSAPVTSSGLPPGAPGSGFERSPVLYVATTDAEGQTTRVHRLIQETSVQFRRQPDEPPLLPGGPANALAVDATVGGSGTLAPGGRVYVTTAKNLYVLDARDLTQVVAKLVPNDDLIPGNTGFSQTTPSVNGSLLFVTRDNGEQLVLDKRTLQPVPPEQFRVPEAGRPVPGSLSFGQPSLSARTVVFGSTRGVFAYRMPPAPASGYWLAAADGGVFAFGEAEFLGSAAEMRLNSPVSGLAVMPSGEGYWLAAQDGGVFAFGKAAFWGSTAGAPLNQPVVGAASTATGKGYWLVAADGGVFNFGDAAFFGSAADRRLAKPVVGMAATPTGRGYWLVAADGAVFNFGDAGDFGSAAGRGLNAPVVGLTPAGAGAGYWLVAADGEVLRFGAAGSFGSANRKTMTQPAVGIAAGASGLGYTLATGDGGTFTFGDARFHGSMGGRHLNGPVVAIAARD